MLARPHCTGRVLYHLKRLTNKRGMLRLPLATAQSGAPADGALLTSFPTPQVWRHSQVRCANAGQGQGPLRLTVPHT